MTPHEVALQYLSDARRLMDPDCARDYCSEVSQIIRRYIEERFGIRASQLTAEDFLRRLADAPDSVPAARQKLLGEFLRHFDQARLACWRCCRPDLEALHESAETFVRQTIASSTDESAGNNSAWPGPLDQTRGDGSPRALRGAGAP